MTINNKQTKISQLDRSQKITIVESVPPNSERRRERIEAPLPETFGYSVGSEIGSPFSGYASEGLLAKGLFITGSSSRFGLLVKRLFTGPELSEIQFEMKFDAFYSGFDEVVRPTLALMFLSVGSEQGINDAIRGIGGGVERLIMGSVFGNRGAAEDTANDLDGLEVDENQITSLIRYLRGPNVTTIHFGTTFTLKNAYLSTVAPQFSNVLDHEGFPMSSTVSITASLQDPMTKEKILNSFDSWVHR